VQQPARLAVLCPIPESRPPATSHFEEAVVRNPVPTNEKEFLSQVEASALIGVHVNTLNKLSKGPDGPPYARLTPRLLRYKRSDLLAWLESRKRAA
jgi:predicted DNA-binding transcriptional regulator AlpA